MALTCVEKAIILSAGQGRRLSPLTDAKPKCLIELAGRSVLHWQLLHLREAGLKEAVVVTGFGAADVEAEVAGLNLPGLQVRTFYNPFYGVADNLATCWLVREEMTGGFLLLNGDTLFEPAIARRLLAAPDAEVTLCVDRKSVYDADDMKVLADADRLLAVGKTIETYNAESIGFMRFSPAGAAAFAQGVEQAMRTAEGLRRWYLSVINDLCKTQARVSIVSIEGLDWAEMDFPSDLPRNLELATAWTVAAGEPEELAG